MGFLCRSRCSQNHFLFLLAIIRLLVANSHLSPFTSIHWGPFDDSCWLPANFSTMVLIKSTVGVDRRQWNQNLLKCDLSAELQLQAVYKKKSKNVGMKNHCHYIQIPHIYNWPPNQSTPLLTCFTLDCFYNCKQTKQMLNFCNLRTLNKYIIKCLLSIWNSLEL